VRIDGTPQRRLSRRACLAALAAAACLPGCAAIPDVTHKPRFHNPFPQLYRIAVLPFYNQSREPTIDGDSIAISYANELQAIPGFEVMPVGVVKQFQRALRPEPQTGSDYQKLARFMNVDAVIIGSVTEYSPYYPPRIGMSVDWYAANPGFHPIPVGYGLPWGTAEEEYIPEDLVEEAEFALAREQLATQTPEPPPEAVNDSARRRKSHLREISHSAATKKGDGSAPGTPPSIPAEAGAEAIRSAQLPTAPLPAEWPDPRGFVPPPPTPTKPEYLPQSRPVISHTRMYDGKNADFTAQLERYYYHQDDARFGGWKGYLHRPEDFVRFCCHLHATETLAARGGAGKSRVIVRWPIGRYER
jgi:hypothetical protein